MPKWVQDMVQEHPGLLFVVATLLPLAAFLVLLLAGGFRQVLRARRDSMVCGNLYRLLGGDTPGRLAAYVATSAIALAFVLSAYGFFLHLQDAAALHCTEHGEHHILHPHHDYKDHAHGSVPMTPERMQKKWSGSLEWARIWPGGADSERGTILRLGYRIDHLSTIMFLMVTLISTLIFLFSMGYMSEELDRTVTDHQVHTEHGHLHRRGRFGRFFLYLSLFCFSMLNLVLADNLFQVFISWELVGICSYLLIGFYYERQSASNAAIKAFVTNRIGDAGFILGLLIIWTYIGTFNFEGIFKQIRSPEGQIVQIAGRTRQDTRVLLFPRETDPDRPHDIEHLKQSAVSNPTPQQSSSMPYWLLVVAGLGVFLGCVGKSAQFPLHVWLPDAMEGPTPVSALIHAATMVAAGVYLVGRCFPLFTPEALLVIAYTGGITLFVAATIAMVMTDIKKVLAYSTVSQLGYMMLALGVGGWVAGLFHLVTHAFFKALLFLCSGSVIYGCHHEQEMTRMGGLYPKMKITALTMLAGVLAIAGIPLFSGWYSKDAILAQALGFVRVHPEHGLLFILPLLTAGITTFYMFRMWFMTFTGEPRDHHVHEHARESPTVMTLPLAVLAFFSIVVAWGWPVWDAGASKLGHHIEHGQYLSVIADFGYVEGHDPQAASGLGPEGERNVRQMAHKSHALAGNLALAVVGLALAFAMLIYYFGVLDAAEAKAQFPGIHRFLWNKWYFDELYSVLLVRPALVVAGWCRSFDSRIIDGIADGSARWTVKISSWSGRFDLGIVDGLVNLTARVVHAFGGWMRVPQTGFIRSYVLFLVLAAIGIFAVLSYFVTLALAQ